METAQSRRTVITALILSLLLHCCIFLIFTLKQNGLLDFEHNEKLISQTDTPSDSPDSSWAATKARASQFGAPVIFRDEKEEDESEEPIVQENIQETKTIDENAQQTIQEHEQINEQQTAQETQNNSEEQKVEPTALAQPVQTVDQHTNNSAQEKLKTEMAKKASSVMQVQKKIQQQKKQPAPAIINTKKTLTLAQLTQGFLDHIHDEGNHSVTMLGKEGAMPTDEQLKHERYLQKLSWCLQNSFKINQNRLPSNEPTQATVEVFLALNKDGTLNQLQLAKSCGDFRLDQFTLFVFRDASSSFPPVPRYLPNNPFKIVFMIEISTINNRSMGVYRY